MTSLLRRRDALIAAGGLGAAAVGARALLGSTDALAADCVLQREVTEGPYYLDRDLVRSGDGDTYLRGIQRTNAKGWARFETVYPGWYRGRTPHIHMKVFVSGNEVHTGQVFMKDPCRPGSTGAGSTRHAASTTRAIRRTRSTARPGWRALLMLRRKRRPGGATATRGRLTSASTLREQAEPPTGTGRSWKR